MIYKIEAALDRLLDLMKSVCCVLLAFLMVSVGYAVIARYFFNISQRWVIEFNEYALLYITFFGAAWLLREDGHVSLDIFYFRLSHRIQAYLDCIVALLGVIITVFIFWFSLNLTLEYYQRGLTFVSTLKIPRVIIFASIPYGSFFLIFQFIRNFINSIKNIYDIESER